MSLRDRLARIEARAAGSRRRPARTCGCSSSPASIRAMRWAAGSWRRSMRAARAACTTWALAARLWSGRARLAVSAVRCRRHGTAVDPAALAAHHLARAPDGGCRRCRRARRRRHHRCAGVHPPDCQAHSQARAPTFPSSTTSRPACGLGARAARARCAATWITCWRCCRSSRRRISGSAVRRARMSAIR